MILKLCMNIKITMRNKIKKIFAIFLVFISLFLFKPGNLYAFPSVLGTKIVGEQSLFIDGNEVTNPNEPVTTDSRTPIFYGYTVPNAEVVLFIESDFFEDTTTSNNDGYWKYTTKDDIEVGQHTLSLQIKDSKGSESDKFLAATFIVPDVKGESTEAISSNKEPLPRLGSLNYLTITFIVLGSLLLLSVAYFFITRRSK